MLQSEPYSAQAGRQGHLCQVYCVSKCLQSVCVQSVAKVFVITCCRTVPGATTAWCIARHLVLQSVCPHCCKSVCAYMLQSEPYSARGHFCQVACDYGMVLIWAIHESKVLLETQKPKKGLGIDAV
jgi:hypothetical protein